MAYKVVTPPTAEPVTLDEARLHLRLGDDETAEDTLITGLISAARELAEHYTRRSLAAQTLEMALDSFPRNGCDIELPMPPVTALTSIKYDDTNGTEQTLATSVYAFSTYDEARRVSLKYGQVWPPSYRQADAVRIRFAAGYAADVVPRAAKTAILLIIGHLFENRQEVVVDNRAVSVQIPLGAQSLLDTIKVYGC